MDTHDYGLTESQILEKTPGLRERWRNRPFSTRLGELLQSVWHPTYHGSRLLFEDDYEIMCMLRAEDVAVVMQKAVDLNALSQAFYVFRNSGLFTEAREIAQRLNAPENLLREIWLFEKFAENRIWGISPAMRSLFRRVHQLCIGIQEYPARLPNILMHGEIGTGKEGMAKAIHTLSNRKEEKFGTINCANQDPNLIRSELFGHVLGSFTGATTNHQGIIAQCNNGGTVFLDEINSLPLEVQGVLLRLLEERQFLSVGGTDYQILKDVLFVAATNQDLTEMVRKRTFRADLHSRLQEQTIKIPNLMERREDIPLLVNQFLRDFGPTEIDNGRSEFAKYCALLAPNLPAHVRSLKSLVGKWVRTTAQNACPYRSAFTKAVDEAISDAKPLPLTKAEVARRIHWQGKTGIAKSNLSGNGPWIPSVQEFVQIGKVRS